MNTKQTIHNDNATFYIKLGNDLGFAGRNVEVVTDSGKAPREITDAELDTLDMPQVDFLPTL